MKKIHINTLGCKVNQYESASFHSNFEELGHKIVSFETESDVVIINTCTVTGKAGAQSRKAVRKALRQHPNAKIIVTGCHAQMAPKELADMEELQGRSVHIIGNGDKHLLVEAALKEKNSNRSNTFTPLSKEATISKLPIRRFANKTRAYLRIQDGCNAFCSYCIVPYTRGRSRSLSMEEALHQAKIFEAEGYKEIVVTGIHVGYYGTDLDADIDISTIMDRLCRTTPYIRYRLSSIEPLEISEQLLDVMVKNSNFMPHLHIPLQSGNDEILLRMNRRYTTRVFTDKLDLCSNKIKDLAIGLDVLVGFPGETDELFAITLSYLEKMDFTYLHVFPYSRRPGTPAADFAGQLSNEVKSDRVKIILKLGEKKKEQFYYRFKRSVRPLLVEKKQESSGLLSGFTDNYIPVTFKGESALKNTIVQVLLHKVETVHVSGSMVQEKNER